MPDGLVHLLLLTLRIRRSSLPGRLIRLALTAVVVLAAVWLLLRPAGGGHREADQRELRAARPRRRRGQRLVHFAGRDGVGKSATANALLGEEHFGAGAAPGLVVPWRPGWGFCELPGAALTLAEPDGLTDHLAPGDVLVLVIDEQLFHSELAFLERVRDHFAEVERVLFVNKDDLARLAYTTSELTAIKDVVRRDSARCVDQRNLVWGSASRVDVATLRKRLERLSS